MLMLRDHPRSTPMFHARSEQEAHDVSEQERALPADGTQAMMLKEQSGSSMDTGSRRARRNSSAALCVCARAKARAASDAARYRKM